MHIKWNSNWLSIMNSSNFLNNLESPKKSGKQGMLTSLNNGMDSVQISQAAINALKSMQKSGESESTESDVVKGFSKILEDKLDGLVTAGMLTAEQETAIQNVLIPQEKGIPAHYRRHEALDKILDGLISYGAITEEQKSAIADALKPPRSGDSDPEANGLEQKLKEKLDSLVTAGTITSDQETAVIDALKPPQDDDSDPEAKGLAQQLKAKLDSLVTAGTLTSEQEKAVQDALISHKKGHPRHHHRSGIENILNSLVDKGTITDEQKDAIEEALNPTAASDNSAEETEA